MKKTMISICALAMFMGSANFAQAVVAPVVVTPPVKAVPVVPYHKATESVAVPCHPYVGNWVGAPKVLCWIH